MLSVTHTNVEVVSGGTIPYIVLNDALNQIELFDDEELLMFSLWQAMLDVLKVAVAQCT